MRCGTAFLVGVLSAMAAAGAVRAADNMDRTRDLDSLSALVDEYRHLRWVQDQEQRQHHHQHRHQQQQAQDQACPLEEAPSSQKQQVTQRLQELEALITAHQRRPAVQAFAANLTARVQAAIEGRQGDCRRRLMCTLSKNCGFGCQIHHAAHCLTVAVATGRSLVLDTQGWQYSSNFEAYFRPVGPCDPVALNPFKQAGVPFPERNRRRHASLDVIELEPTTGAAPPAMPPDAYAEAARFHPHPALWWVGQLVRYILTPAHGATWWEADALLPLSSSLRPYAGVHVRRSDKVTSGEAAEYELAAYLRHVPAGHASVYLATDEPTLLAAARAAHPGRVFHGAAEVAAAAAAAGVNSTRYSDASLRGLLGDVAALARADFLVGTFSSHVSRLAHELAQTLRADAAFAVRSLDAAWYYGGQQPEARCLVAAHAGLPAGRALVVDDAAVVAAAAPGFLRDVVAGTDVPLAQTRPCALGYLPLFAPVPEPGPYGEGDSDDEEEDEEDGIEDAYDLDGEWT